MKKQFTPGEWKQSHRQIPNDADGMYSTQVYTENGETIASLAWYAKPPVIENGKKVIGSYRKENAKLISAAPNMLEALIAITDNIDKWLETDIPADKETSKKLYDDAKKAIKKAIG
jgi:hypothetical protein